MSIRNNLLINFDIFSGMCTWREGIYPSNCTTDTDDPYRAPTCSKQNCQSWKRLSKEQRDIKKGATP